MAVTVTQAVQTASTSNVTSYASGAFTPALNDILIVVVAASGTVLAAPTMTGGPGYTLIDHLGFNSAATPADSIYIFRANGLAAASSQTVTFDCTGDAATGCIITVFRVAGLVTDGGVANCIRQTKCAAGALSTAPAATLTNAVNTNHPVISVVGTGTNPPALTVPSGWAARDGDTGYNTPPNGADSAHRVSGETGSTITWGSTSATAWGVAVIELMNTYVVNGAAGSFTVSGGNATLTQQLKCNGAAGSFSVTGNNATLLHAFPLHAATGAFTLSGNNATMSRTYVLNTGTGAIVLSGKNATLTRQLKLNGAAGSFLLTGNNADLTRQLKLNSATGVFSLTGNNADLLRALKLAAGTGSFAITGNNSDLIFSRKLSASAGLFTLTGNNATLTRAGTLNNYVLNAGAGSFAIGGNNATLKLGRVILGASGAFSVTGGNATFTRTYKLNASAGVFSITGNNAILSHMYKLNAQTGVFQIVGNDASLRQRLEYKLNAETGVFVLTGNDAIAYRKPKPRVYLRQPVGFDEL